MKLILKTTKRVIPIFLLILFVSICVLIFFQTEEITNRVKGKLIETLEDKLNQELKIDSITLFPLNRITLHQIELRDDGKKIVEADRIILAYQFKDILKGPQEMIRGIKEIEVVEPQLYIRKEADSYNFEKFIKQREGNSQTKSDLNLETTVKIFNGSIHYDDNQRTESLEKIKGKLSIDGSQIGIDFTSRIKSIQTSRIKVAGSITPELTLNLDFSNIDFNPDDYDLNIKGLEKLTIKGSGSAKLKQRDGTLSYSGNLDFQNGNLLITQFPMEVRGAEGQIKFNNKQLVVNKLTGKTIAGDFAVTGQVSNLTDPDLAIDITTDGIDISQIQRYIPELKEQPLVGEVKGKVSILGSVKKPLVKANLKLPKITYNGMALKNIDLRAWYQDEFITLQNIDFTMNQGSFKGYNGYLNFAKQEKLSYSINVETENFNLHDFLTTIKLEGEIPSGNVDGSLYLYGNGLDMANMSAIGFVNVFNGKYRDVAFDHLKANFWFTEKELGLSRLELVTPHINSNLAGNVKMNGEIDLTFEPSYVNLDWLGQQLGVDLKGNGMINGELRGKITDPTFRGQVELTRGYIYNQTFDKFIGEIEVDKSKLVLSDTNLTKGDSQFSFGGEINFDEESLNLTAEIEETSLAKIRNFQDLYEIPDGFSGDISGEVLLTGAWANPNVAGHLKAAEGMIFDYPYQETNISFEWKDKDLEIDAFDVTYQETSIYGSGKIEDLEEVIIDLNAKEFDLSLVDQLPKELDLKGKVKLDGQLKGKLTSPTFNGIVSSDSLEYDQISIEQLSVLIKYEENSLFIKPMKMINGDNEYTLIGEIIFDQKMLDMRVRTKHANVDELFKFANLPIRDLGYIMDGELLISGNFKNPLIEVDAIFSDNGNGKLKLAGNYDFVYGLDVRAEGQNFDLSSLNKYIPGEEFPYTLDGRMTVKGDLKDPESKLDITLKEPDQGQLQIKGEASLSSIGLKIKGNHFDLTPLQDYIPGEKDDGGQSRKESENSLLQNLKLDIDLDLRDSSLENYKIKYFGGSIDIMEGAIIKLDQKMVLPDNNTVTAKGLVAPLDKEGPINLKLEITKGNLEILPLFVPGVEDAGGKGWGNIDVTGTMDSPQVRGAVNISAGFVKIKGLDLIKDISGEVKLVKDQALVKDLRGKIGQGNAKVEGSVELDGFMPDELNLEVDADNYHFVYGSIDAHGDGKLYVSGPLMEPLIKGDLLIHNSEVGVAPFDWPMPEGDAPIKPKFYLVLHPGDNLIVTGDSPIKFNATVTPNSDDKLIIDTRDDVILSGELRSRSGTFNIYNSNFRITEAKATFVKFNKVLPLLDIHAMTTVNAYNIYVDLTGLPPDQLAIDLRSEPELTKEEITMLLANKGGLGYLLEGEIDFTDMLSDEIWRYISQGLRSEFLNKLEDSLEKKLSLDKVYLDPVLLGDARMNLQVGKYLDDNLYIVYNRTFSENPEQSIGFEYQFHPNIGLEGTYKGDGNYQFGLKADFAF